MSVADIVALINADTKLTAAQKLEVIGDAYDIKLHTTSAVLLDLHGGRYKEGESLDGGNFEVGTRGPYAFPDAHTLVLQEDCCPGITTFQVTAVPNGFTLKRTSAPQDEKDAIIGRILFQSAPFTLAP